MTSGKIVGNKYVINGVATDVSEFYPDMSAEIYYEVVRLIDGKALFLQDHLDRLKTSLAGSGLDYPGDEMIVSNLALLKENNDFTVGNIRICVQKTGPSSSQLLCYFVPHIYPEVCMYLSGVQVVTYPHVRPSPRIKKWDNQFRTSVHQYMREYGVYEVLLLNEEKQITEGSRSNVFFLDAAKRLITPPEEDVLPGITRKYVLEICKEKGLEVVQRPIYLQELESMEACFISGTSPKVLPVWQIDGFQFKADHPELKLIMEAFESIITQQLTSL